MGNSITANVNLDYEVYHHQEAIEAGKPLTGKIIIQVQERLDPTILTLEVNGKEKTVSFDDSFSESPKLKDKHAFFRADVHLHKADSPIEPNTYIFPFNVPLPKSLPASRSYEDKDSQGSFSIEYNLKLKTSARGKFPSKRSFLVASAPRDDEPVPCLMQPKPINTETFGIDFGKGPIFMGAHVRDTNVLRGQTLEISLACRNESTWKIDRAELTLEEEYYWTTQSTGGHGKVTLVKHVNVNDMVPGIRIIGLHPSEIDDRQTDEEAIARRMLRDLKSRRNTLSIQIPKEAKESFTGIVVQVSHYIKFTLITKATDETSHPSIKIPIHIGSARPASLTTLEHNSDHVFERGSVRFPMVKATHDSIVVGKNAGVLDNEESFSVPIPLPTNDEPTLLSLREELAASLNDYDFISEKMKDLEWAIFFASLNPNEFGSVIAHVSLEFAQTRVAALLARNFGGDFTCAHCAAAIRNASPVFRTNMVEGLLAYCVDLSENNNLIREQLSDFEQIIVALHALNEDQDGDSQRAERSSIVRGKQAEAPPATAKTNFVTPRRSDILLGVNDHPPTKFLLQTIRQVAYQGEFPEYCPPAYRKIIKKFRDQRFLFCPDRSQPNSWREVNRMELIEYIGILFDRSMEEKEALEKEKAGEIWHSPEGKSKKKWQEELHNSGNDWELAVTIHQYTSAVEECEDIDSDHGPSSTDICFDKANHPGNEALFRAVRIGIEENPDTEWSPPLYRAIKGQLEGRKFFIRVGKTEWRESTHIERREIIAKIFEEEKQKGTKEVERRKSSHIPKTEKPPRHLSGTDHSRSKSPGPLDVSERTNGGSRRKSQRSLDISERTDGGSGRKSRTSLSINSSARRLNGKLDDNAGNASTGEMALKDDDDSMSGRLKSRIFSRSTNYRTLNEPDNDAPQSQSRSQSTGALPLNEISDESWSGRQKARRSLGLSPGSQRSLKGEMPLREDGDHSSSGQLRRHRAADGRSDSEKNSSEAELPLIDDGDHSSSGRLRPRRSLGTRSNSQQSLKESELSVHENGDHSSSGRLKPRRSLGPRSNSQKSLKEGERSVHENGGNSSSGRLKSRRSVGSGSNNQKNLKGEPSASEMGDNSTSGRLRSRRSIQKNSAGEPTANENGDNSTSGRLRSRRSIQKILADGEATPNENGDNSTSGRLRSRRSITDAELPVNENGDNSTSGRLRSRRSIQQMNSSSGESPAKETGDNSTSNRLKSRRSIHKNLKEGEPPASEEGDRSKTGRVKPRVKQANEKTSKDTKSNTGEIGLNDENEGESDQRSLPKRGLSRKDSIRKIGKRNMRHPRDMDICYGSDNHPGTLAFAEAVAKTLDELGSQEWAPSIYKSIRNQIQGRRFFVRLDADSPWREASPEERVEFMRDTFEKKRKEISIR